MIGLHAKAVFSGNGSLCFIPNLLEREFGIQKGRDRANVGTCFVAQVSFSIASMTGIRASVISSHIFRNVGVKADYYGWTLSEILRTFELPVLTRQGPKWLKIRITEYNHISQVCEALMLGYPVISIIPRGSCDVLENEAKAYNDGSSFTVPIRPAVQNAYHSMLAIGVDAGSLEDFGGHSFVILRDSRHTYCHKGYIRVSTEVLQNGFQFCKYITVNVLEIQE